MGGTRHLCSMGLLSGRGQLPVVRARSVAGLVAVIMGTWMASIVRLQRVTPAECRCGTKSFLVMVATTRRLR